MRTKLTLQQHTRNNNHKAYIRKVRLACASARSVRPYLKEMIG